MHTSTEDRSHTKLRREDLAHSILPWSRAPDQRQRSVRRYLIYIYRDRKPSQHVTVGLAWGSPQIEYAIVYSGWSNVQPTDQTDERQEKNANF